MAVTLHVAYNGQAFSPVGDKGRFVLPPAFRKAVRDSSDGRILCIAKHDRWPCLVGFGLSRLPELEQQLDREERLAVELGREFDRDARATALYGFEQVPFDESGRFVMPEFLAQLGRIEDGLYFQGAGRFFTIWNPAELARMGDGWESAQAACASLAQDSSFRIRKK